MKLQVKLHANLSDKDRKAVFEAARKAGASAVRALLPESSDPELSTLYTIEANDDISIKRLLRVLSKHKAVDFVEREVKRKLK